MTAYAVDIQALSQTVTQLLGDKIRSSVVARGELTIEVAAADYVEVARQLRDAPGCQFEQLIDLCGVDYSDYRNEVWEGPRYCVVLHLLSITLNQRLRLKVFAPDDDFPVVATINVEMRYDEEQKRVVYQPVTIEPREITPRIIREDNYGGLH